MLEMIRSFQQSPPDVSPTWQAKRRLAAVLRGYANAIGSSGAREDEILALAAQLEERLCVIEAPSESESGDSGSRDAQLADSVAPGMEDFYDRGPMTGQSNPVAPPAEFKVDVDGRRVVGEVTYAKAYEGAPGCVHGGFVSAILDEVLGMACIFSGAPAMTAELTVRFRQHTPIETLLRMEARMDRVSGRKIETSGELLFGDVVVADAKGLFIGVSSEKFAALRAAQQSDPQ